MKTSAILAFITYAVSASAQDDFSIAANGAWSAGASWTGGSLPDFSTDISIEVGAFTSTVDADFTTGLLALTDAATVLNVDATLSCVNLDWSAASEINLGADGKITGLLPLGATGNIEVTGAGSHTIAGGEVDLSALLLGGGEVAIAADATLQATGTTFTGVAFEAAASAEAAATFAASADAHVFADVSFGGSSGGLFVIEAGAEAELDASASAELTVKTQSTLRAQAGSVIRSSSESAKARVSVAANAALEFQGATESKIRNLAVSMASSGQVAVRSSSSLRVEGESEASSGSFEVEASATLTIDASAALDAASSTACNVAASGSLVVETGASAAFRTANFAADSAIEVGYVASASADAALDIAASAVIDSQAELNIMTSGNSNLKAGVRYKVVSYGSLDGGFGSIKVNGQGEFGAGAGRRLLADGDEVEQDDSGVYYTPANDSPASLTSPTWVAVIAAAGLSSLLLL